MDGWLRAGLAVVVFFRGAGLGVDVVNETGGMVQSTTPTAPHQMTRAGPILIEKKKGKGDSYHWRVGHPACFR